MCWFYQINNYSNGDNSMLLGRLLVASTDFWSFIMTTMRRFNQQFNRITFVGAMATIIIVSIWAIDWAVMYFGMVN